MSVAQKRRVSIPPKTALRVAGIWVMYWMCDERIDAITRLFVTDCHRGVRFKPLITPIWVHRIFQSQIVMIVRFDKNEKTKKRY